MTFADTYPRPEPVSADATRVAGHYAAHVLHLLGRAERRRELHGCDDATYRSLLSLADSEAETAYILYAASQDSDADAIAHRLLIGQEAVGAHRDWAHTIAKRAGYSPEQVRFAGYES